MPGKDVTIKWRGILKLYDWKHSNINVKIEIPVLV